MTDTPNPFPPEYWQAAIERIEDAVKKALEPRTEADKVRYECRRLLSTAPDAALPEIAEFLKDCIEFWNWKAQYVSPPETEAKGVEVTMNPPTIRPEFVVDIEITRRVMRPDFSFPEGDDEP